MEARRRVEADNSAHAPAIGNIKKFRRHACEQKY